MKSKLSPTLRLVAIALLLIAENAYAQPNAYVRSVSGEPWGSGSNIQSLNTAFGAGNWRDLRFETVNVNALLSGTDYIFLEGSDSHANALESFLITNLPALQNWVQSGGLLFINSAPNQGDGMSLGFGGISLMYAYYTPTAVAVDPEHPIFHGPFLPVGNTWSGSSFGHARVTGPGLKPLIVDSGNHSSYILAEKRWGRGLVLFGGMTTTNYHSPSPQASNLRSNILSLELLNGANDAGVASLESPKNFCPGTLPIDVTIKNFGINVIENVTVNWTFDGILQTAIAWASPLDTTGGVNPNSALITLGSKNFVQGVPHNLKVWTSAPNGLADTVALNDTLAVTLQPSLAGTFTIGGASPNYTSFSNAIAALKAYGLCGPVTFNVRNGTYNEQVTLAEFQGAGESNQITFQSESGDSTSVILTFSSINSNANYTVQLNGADYVTFRKMTIRATGSTYGRVLDIRNKSGNNRFRNNRIQGVNTTSTSTNMAAIHSESGNSNNENDNNNRFEHNAILNGSYGFYYTGYSSGSNNREFGTTFRNNIVTNAYYIGVYVQNQDSVKLIGNDIRTNSLQSNYRAISLQYCYDGSEVSKNNVQSSNGGYGIYTYDCDGSASRNLIANNFIQIGGITSDAYGLALEYSDYVDLYHNTIRITNTSPQSRALYTYSGTDLSLLNNIIVNTGGGYGLHVGGSWGISALNYNNFYVTGPNFGYWDGNIANFAAWKSAHGFDGNSLNVDPRFVSTTDLHVREITLNGMATPLAEITDDIDGQVRDASNPDIGADEFIPKSTDVATVAVTSPGVPFNVGTNDVTLQIKNNGLDALTSVQINWMLNGVSQDAVNWTGSLNTGISSDVFLGAKTFDAGIAYTIRAWTSLPNGLADGDITNDTIQVANLYAALNGTYTIGGTSPNFANFSEALTALTRGGVVDSVIFNVRAGTYNEQLSIPDISGSSVPNTVVFQSESGDSTSVILSYSATSAKNYTVELAGADGVTFRNLTITTVNNSYGQVISIRNKSHNNTFKGNVLQGRNLNSTSTNMAVVISTESQDNNNTIINNRILYGSYGVYYYGVSNLPEDSTIIHGNIFDGQYYTGIRSVYQTNAQITNNIIRINSNWSGAYGMYLQYCANESRIIGNNILMSNGGHGIYYTECYGSETQRGLVANNFINIQGGTSQSYGLFATYSSDQNIYHNTIRIATNRLDTYTLYLNSLYNFNITNNILTNTGGGFAIFSNGSGFNSDHNDFYTTAGNFAYYDGPQPDLASWQNVTGGDQHSFSIDPRYISSLDLHAREIVLNDAGQALPEVTNDIDGEPRSVTNPDIGADEFNPGLADAGIYALINPNAPFAQGSQPVTVALKNHGLDTLRNVQIQWTVNNTAQPVIHWTGALKSGDTTQVTLGNFLFNPVIAYEIKSWSVSPNNAIDADHTNDTISVNNLYSALTGTYTIGGGTPDFATFTDAVVALTKGGVVGPVTFNIRAGNYSEQISIPQIIGSSASDTVVFQSATGADDVFLTFSANSTRNYTLQLDGVSYFTFKNLSISAGNTTYGTAVRIQNQSNHNRFESNVFNGVNTTSSSTAQAVIFNVENSIESDNAFIGNKFIRGSYGYYGFGQDYGMLESGTVLESNTFENQYYAAIWMYYQDAPKIRLNVIKTSSNYTSFFGIRSVYSRNQLKISRNDIQIANGGYGIYLDQNEASFANRGLVANNFISIAGTTTAQGLFIYYSTYQNIFHNNIHITSTLLNNSNACAAYLYRGNTLDVKNNILANSGGSYAIFQDNVSEFSCNYNDLYSTGINLGYWSGNRTNLQAWSSYSGQDQNSISVDPFFYSNTDLHISNVSLNARATKIDSITEDFDGNPRSFTPDIGADEFIPPTEDASILSLYAPSNPVTAGPNDIVVQLFNNASVNLNNVTINWKVNGQQQPVFEWTGSLAPSSSDSVTIGSFVFQSGIPHEITAWSSQPNGLADMAPANDSTTASGLFVGMSGIFTIGGISADFPNFTQAVEALHERKVSGPVTFRVTNGIYNERITINQIQGASSDHPIIFESASGDSTKVTLTSATNSSQNYTLRLLGGDHLTFRKMKLLSTGNIYGTVIEMRDGANYNTFESCVIQSTIYNSTFLLESRAAVYSGGSKDDFNVFRNNVFRDGACGFYYFGAGNSLSNLENGTIIENNLFEDQFYTGIWLYYQSAPKIGNNSVITFANNSNFYGIYGAYLNNEVDISRNKISSNLGGYGIRLDNSIGTSDLRGAIYNNFIHLGGTSTASGIYSASSNYQDFSYNNINITSTNTSSSGTAFFNSSGSNIRVRNNILVNKGGGYAYYNNTGTAISASDHNDIYSTGINLAFWQTNFASLETLQAASGKDANSISVDPSYAGTSDLHVNQANLDGAGTPIANIASDIDGQLRHEVTPDIGADEFGSGLTTNDIGVIALIGPSNSCVLDNTESIRLRIQNFGIDTISNFSVTYILNDSITVTENITGAALKGGKSLEYRFTTPADLSAAGFYNFTFYTTLAADSNVNNDTLYSSVIRHYPAVTANVSPNDTICQGSYAYLSAGGGTSYAWRVLGSNNIFRYGQNIYVNPSSDITYVVEVANEFGCSDTDTVSVFVLPAPERPSIEIIGSTSVCTRDTVRLISSVKQNIVWNTGAATSEIQVFNPGTYTVTHRDSVTGCTSARSVTLSYTPPPYIYASTNPICQGASTTLTVAYGAQYRWSTGETTSSITVSPSSNTAYTVDVINPDGCEYLGLTATIFVDPIRPTPQITSISSNTEICPGSTATLKVEGNALQYAWSNGAFGTTIVVSPTVDTQYTVTATNGRCSLGSDQASVFVKVLPKPIAPIIVATGSSTLSFCDADSITLTSSDIGDSLRWSTGATSRSITVFDPGVYSVAVYNKFGCSNAASVTITDPPVPYIVGKNTVCDGESTTLTVNNGSIYLWSTGATSRSITVSPHTTTTYYVDITNEEGCQYRDNIRVTILPKPVITGITGNTTICAGEEITLNVSGTANSFIWSEGGSGTSIKVRPSKTTTYTVTATNGCTDLNFNDFDKVTVTVLPIPVKPVITASGSTVICEGNSIGLTSSIAGTIVWSTGDSTQSITASKAGIYTVTNRNQFGCTQSDTVEIFNPDKPQLIANGFTTICRGDDVQLTFTNAVTFNWSTGATTQSIVVSPNDTTTYSVSASNALGCNYTNSIRINVIAPVPPDSVNNMTPHHDQSGLSLPLALSWAPATNASNYDIYIWPDSLARPATPLASNIDQIGYIVKTGLDYGAIYNWQVISKNSCHETPGPVQQFSLRELPDLIVTKVETPKTAFSGQLIDITWQITNTGLGDTDPKKTWIEAVYLSADQTLETGLDTYLGGTVNLTALDADQGYRNTGSFRLPKGIAGERYVIIVTDYYNTIQEVNNNNNGNHNLTSMLVYLTPPPDLQVDVVQAPLNAFSGQSIDVSWTVKNKGTGTTDVSSWRDRIFISQDSVLRTATKLGEFDHTGHLDPDQLYTRTQSVQVPEGIFGSYFIYVVTDVNNNLFEHAFESNNTGRSNGLQVILTPPPDLVVTNITVPSSASNKETIAVSWEVENQGGSPVSGKSWNDRIYISNTPVFDVTKSTRLDDSPVSAELDLGGSYTGTRNVKIPDGINGPFFIYVAADIDNRVFEYLNDNNNITRSNTINILSPDLIISEITLPDTAYSGNTVDVTWKVKNEGPGKLFSSTWEDVIWVDNSALYHADSVKEVGKLSYTSALLPGETIVKQKTVTLPNGIKGTQFVHIQTDRTNKVYEAGKETNNLSHEPLHVKLSPWPDLKPQIILFDTDTLTAGQTVPITYRVTNDGVADAAGAWVDKIYISVKPVFDPKDTVTVMRMNHLQGLKADSAYQVSTDFNLNPWLTEGSYYFYLFTDAKNILYEHSDEANNITRIGPVYVKEYPPVDFTVTSLTAKDSAFSGTTINIQWAVQNAGDAASLSGYWFDAALLSDDATFNQTGDLLLEDWRKNGPLAKGVSYTNEQKVILPNGISGDKYLILVNDYGKTDKERFLLRDDDRSNNFRAVPIRITLTPPSDLVVAEFDAPTEGISGQPISVAWTVTNQGVGSTTAGSWTDKIYLSTDFKIDQGDPLLKSYSRAGNLNAAGSYTVTSDVFIPISAEGNYILIIKTDNNDIQYEHGAENNNTSASIIAVTKPLPADLIVSEIITPDTVTAGGSISVQWTIKNTGTNPASGVMSDILYFSADETWDINDVVLGEYPSQINLPPLSEQTRSLTTPVQGVSLSDYYILVRTDVRNNILESDDANNTSASDDPLAVSVPELVLNQTSTATLVNGASLYYRLEVPPALQGESLLVTLEGDSLNGANEFYIRYSEVPDRVTYDFSHEDPFAGDQEIVIPDAVAGTYYLLVHGSTRAGTSQTIELFAKVLPFEIRSVNAKAGGNTGKVTVQVNGSKFIEDMQLMLRRGPLVIKADTMQFINSTRVFATFNLDGADIGLYDLLGVNDDLDTAALVQSFKVEEGRAPLLLTNVVAPSSTRPGAIISISIEFANGGNVNIENPVVKLISAGGAPVSFTVQGLNEGQLELPVSLTEPRGPEGVLRPGATGTVIIYGQATSNLSFILVLPQTNNVQ